MIELQNTLIENLHLSELSSALNLYFSTGNFTNLVNTIKETQQDIKCILDN